MGNIAMLQARRPGPMIIDRELIQRCQQGDQAAFELLVKKHERRVFGLVYQMVRQPSEVEDIAQEYLAKQGINCTILSEAKKGFLLLTNNFDKQI